MQSCTIKKNQRVQVHHSNYFTIGFLIFLNIPLKYIAQYVSEDCHLQIAQLTLSTNPWWRKNSGAAAESNEHIVPSIVQCGPSCKVILKAISKLSNFAASVANTWATATLSGGFPLKNLLKHEGLADGTSFHGLLKGPSSTHPNCPPPFPPKPPLPAYHKSLGLALAHGFPETTLQSQ